MSLNNLKILVADDHPLLVQGLSSVISRIHFVAEIIEAKDGIEAYEKIVKEEPDVAVLDIDMPGMSGVEVARKLKGKAPCTKIVIITLHKEKSLFMQAREIGVSGYLLKEFSLGEIERCIYEVGRGNTYISPAIKDLLETDDMIDLSIFTKTERNILLLIAKGKSTKEIAGMLFVSPKTIENHRSNIVKKLNLEPGKNSLLKWVYKYSRFFC